MVATRRGHKNMCNLYINYLFIDNETGEQFFVELRADEGTDEELMDKAMEIAADYFDEPEFIGIVDGETAEMLGYDTY